MALNLLKIHVECSNVEGESFQVERRWIKRLKVINETVKVRSKLLPANVNVYEAVYWLCSRQAT